MESHATGEVQLRQEPLNETARVARAAVSAGIADAAVIAAVKRPAPLTPGTETEESAEESVWESIQRFLTGTSLQVVDRRPQKVRWPLFFLACPDVEGAQTAVTIQAGTGRTQSWTLRLFGSGFDRSTSMSQVDTHQAIAVAGQQRLLHVECDVEVVKYVLRRPGKDPVEGVRLEIDGATRVTVGIADLGAPAWPWRAPARTLERLNYQGALPGGRQEWSRTESYTRNTSLVFGLDSSGVAVGTSLGYEINTTVSLLAALPGGVDWLVKAPDRCPGVFVEPS